MPLTLILDIGAMLQMVILIYEEHDKPYQKWLEAKSPVGEEPRRGGRVLGDAVAEAWAKIERFVMRKIFRQAAPSNVQVRTMGETRTRHEGSQTENLEAQVGMFVLTRKYGLRLTRR
jgi:hypothetical protein